MVFLVEWMSYRWPPASIIIENVDYCKIVPITEQQSRLFSKNVILFGFEGMKLEEIKKKR